MTVSTDSAVRSTRILVPIVLFLALFMNWLVTGPEAERQYLLTFLGLFPKYSIILVELSALLLLLSVFRDIRTNPESVDLLLKIAGVAAAVVLVHLPLTLFYGGSPVNFGIGFRNYFGFMPVLLVGFTQTLKGEDVKKYLVFLLILCLIQFPISVLQFREVIGSPDVIATFRESAFDRVSGSMGGFGANLLSMILAACASVLYAFSLEARKKWLFYAGILVLIAPMILSEAKGGLIYLVVLGLFFFLKSDIGIKQRIRLVVVFFLVISVFMVAYAVLLGTGRAIWSVDFLMEYLARTRDLSFDVRLNRLDALLYSVQTIWDQGFSLIFGVGLGNATRNNFIGGDGAFYSFGTDRNFLNRGLLEIGFLGFFLLGMLLVAVYRRVKAVYLNSPDRTLRQLAFGFLGVLILIPFGMVHEDMQTRVQYAYPFAYCLGILLGEYARMKRRAMTSAAEEVTA